MKREIPILYVPVAELHLLSNTPSPSFEKERRDLLYLTYYFLEYLNLDPRYVQSMGTFFNNSKLYGKI